MDVQDLETPIHNCERCGNERVRFVHVLYHPEIDKELLVGCVCAEQLTQDYDNPKSMEKWVKNNSKKRENWLKRWKVSMKGNHYINTSDYNAGVLQTSKGDWYIRIGDTFYKEYFKTMLEAQLTIYKILVKQ